MCAVVHGNQVRELPDGASELSGAPGGAQTLAKGLTLLDLVAALQGSHGVGLLELARALGWHKSTTHRLLTRNPQDRTARTRRGYPERGKASDPAIRGLQSAL